MDIYDLFSKFELDLLPNDWVKNLWKDDFSEVVDFPAEYEMFLENTDISELISTATIFIKEWLETPNLNTSFEIDHPRSSLSTVTNRSSIDTKSWQNLIANNVQHKALIAALSIFILRGKNEKQMEVKRLGLMATDLYILLLSIPGSQVFHIFNSILFSHAIESLKICNILVNPTAKQKPAPKKRKGRNADDDFEEEDEVDNESDDDILPSEKSTVIKLLNKVLSDFLFMLKKFQFKGQDDSLLLTIQILILLTRLERNSSCLFSKSPPHNSPSYLSFKAYKILMELCCIDHGDVEETVTFIMREMMPGFLIFSDQKDVKLSAKEVLIIKDHSIQFIKNLLTYVKDPAFLGVYTLIQQICVRIPDKADLRAKGVQVIIELLDVVPYSLYAETVVWIMNFCHHDQVRSRVTGLEIVTKLLYGNERTPTSPLRPFLKNKPTVTKGGTGKKPIVTNGDTGDMSIVANGDAGDKSIVANGDEGDKSALTNSDIEDKSVNGIDEDDDGIILTQQPDFSRTKYLLGTIFSRCQDNSSTVRAKALAIIANLISTNNRNMRYEMESIFVTPYLDYDSIEKSSFYEKGFFDFHNFIRNVKKEVNQNIDPLPGAKAIISLLECFIQDEKVFVRKSALQTLANIFLMNQKWMNNKLLQVMVDNCRDMSVSIRKQLVQCLTDLLNHYPTHNKLPRYWVQGVMQLLADQELKSQEKVLEALQTTILDNLVPYERMKTDLHALPWVLLSLITEHNKCQLFVYACHKWSLTNTIKQSLITTIKTHIGTENNSSAWFLLSSFSVYLNIKDPEFVLDYFMENVLDSQQVDEYCCQLVTEVMHLNWRGLPPLSQINLCDNLLRHLSQFMVPLPLIARCVDICQLITETHAESPEQAVERIKEWSGNLISMCEVRLEKIIGPGSPLVVEDEERLCQYIFTVGETASICPGQLKHTSLLLLQNLLMADEEDDAEELHWKGKVSAKVQAVAVVTLGKLCLQKEHTAKVLVPLFANLLSETEHTEIKINAMILLTDMCVKFTSVVENHLPEMCICLRDKDLQVRENTLKLLIQLIQEDYLKLRCPMLFHLLTMLGDEDQLIRDMISSFIINSLLVKQKNILVQHFVESLFHYNAYMSHPTYSKGAKMGIRERQVFGLEGEDQQEERRHIYRFMLENMTDESRFKVTYRLCTDILAGVAEEEIELTPSGTYLLRDALYVLSSEEIRLSHLRPGSKDDEDDGEDGGEVKQAIHEAFKKTIVTQIVKKNMIENVVPIFIKLKHKLKQIKSPLVRDLMACLRELMKDYKAEINEILAADKELAAEISHDLQTSSIQEEDEGNDPEENGDVLKDVLIKVVSEAAKKTLNMSRTPRARAERLSVCSQFSQSSRKSVASNKSLSQTPSNKTPPGTSRTSPGTSRTSPGTSRTSHNANRTSPVANGTTIGPKITSPGGNEPQSELHVELPNGEPLNNGKSFSPSGRSVTSETSSSQNERDGEGLSLPAPRKSRSSTSSSASEASTKSQSKKPARKNKKKR